MNGRRELADHSGYDRRDDEGDEWRVFHKSTPNVVQVVRALRWYDAREQGIQVFHGDYSSIEAERVKP